MSAPTTSPAPTTLGHFEEIVTDGEQYIVGCECGWTCAGHADDPVFAVRIWMLHLAALQSRYNLA